MVVGFVLAALFLVLVSKFVTKRVKNLKLDAVMLKVHKVVGVVMFVMALVHTLGVWQLRKQRPCSMYVIGISMVVLIGLGIASYCLRKKLAAKWIVFHQLIAVLIFVLLVSHVVIGFQSLASYQQLVSETEIENVDFSKLQDGVYTGAYDVGYVYVKVEVTIKDHRIDNVNIVEHRTEQGERAEKIVETIVKEQSVKVDAIAGATNSSKVIMKAVENALSGK